MNYILISSLEHIAVAKIATTLWNQKEIKNLMEDFLFSMSVSNINFLNPETNEEWVKVEGNVRNKVHQLPLPERLKEKVLKAIKPVGSLILKWMTSYADAFQVEFSDIDLPKNFCWTSRGILDETKTAKLLIKDKNIHITRGYKISCIYCLEANIKELWNELSEDNKKSICSETSSFSPNKLVRYWTDFIYGSEFNSDYLLVCDYACQSGNRIAAEYFFKKLRPINRDIVLHALAMKIHYISVHKDVSLKLRYDIALSLLTHTSQEQQIQFFQTCPFAVLVCLLDWPWQSFFTKTVNYLRSCLPEDHFDNKYYNCLLRKIISKIIYGYKDFMYQKVLEEYWKQSSDQCKISFFSSFRIACLLSKLYALKDMNNIKMILHDETISVYVLRFRRYICEYMIEYEEWDLLKFFIQECVSSELEMLNFKRRYEKIYGKTFDEKHLSKKN